MTEKTYYRAVLQLPLALPVLSLPLLALPEPVVEMLAIVPMLLLYSLLVGGIPYLLFLAGFHQWMTGKPAVAVRRALRLAPLVFTAVLTACLGGLFVVLQTSAGVAGAFALFGGFALMFGYAYVGLAEAGRAMLLRRGRLEADDDEGDDDGEDDEGARARLAR